MDTVTPQSPSPDDRSWLTLPEAARSLGVSTYTVRRWIREGRIAAEKRPGRFGEQYFVAADAVAADGGGSVPDALPPQARHARTGLIGRDAELATMRAVLDEAESGRGSLVIVSGEAGIGKTTLVRDAIRMAMAAGFQAFAGHCYDLEVTPPFGPWIELMQRCGVAAGPASPVRREVQRDILAFLAEVSGRQPAVVVLEDMHWADQASVELLRVVGRQVETLPLVVVVTIRSTDLRQSQPLYLLLPHLVREGRTTRIRLRRLERAEVDALVGLRYALPADDRERVAAFVFRYAEGNPFFTDELLNTLDADGVIQPDGDGWRAGALADVPVPPLIHQVIDGHLERLTPEARGLLQIAAIIGGEVPVDLWQAVSEAGDDELAEAIEQALDAQVLVELGDRPALVFRHALIRKALYERMILLRRRRWHLRVAEVLLEQSATDPDALAYHLLQAGDARAVDWLIQAGRRAAATHAYPITIERFEQALRQLGPDRLADRAWLLCELAEAYRYTRPRRALAHLDEATGIVARLDDRALRAIVMRSRSHIRGFLGEHALEELEEAVALFDALDDAGRRRIAASPLAYTVSEGTVAQRLAYYGRYDSARERALRYLTRGAEDGRIHEAGIAWLGLAKASAALGDHEQAREAFANAQRFNREVGSAYMVALATAYEYSMVLHVYFPDRVEERRRLIERVDQSYRDSLYGTLSEGGETMRLYPALILDGRWDEARASAAAMYRTEAVRIDCATVLAGLDWLQGDADAAWAHILFVLPDGPETPPGTTYYLEVLELQRIAAALSLDAGDVELAGRWIRALERWQRWSHIAYGRAAPEIGWARCAELEGDLDRAAAHIRHALELAAEPRQPLSLIEAHRVAARLGRRADRLDEAQHHAAQSLALAREVNAPYEIAASLLAAADVVLATGRRSEAGPLLDEAAEQAARLGARPLLDRVEDSRAAPSPRQRGPGGLSSREVDVLRLVARGFTDAEVAEQLYISPRTVSGHLQSIYNKLGISSRTAATAFAYEHDLV